MNSIEQFITLIRESCPELQTKIFTEGACYQFFLILKHRFPTAVAHYDGDHVITYIDGQYYDIRGEVTREGHIYMESSPKKWGFRYTP